MADYYVPPPEKRVPCNVRIPGSLKDNLLAIVKFWQLMASSEGHDPRAIDLTFVCERLLRIGADGVWGQARAKTGHEGVPKSNESWDRIKEALARAVSVLAAGPLHQTPR